MEQWRDRGPEDCTRVSVARVLRGGNQQLLMSYFVNSGAGQNYEAACFS